MNYKNSELFFESKKSVLKELKQRIIFVIIAIIIFRIGSFIPIPGINIAILNKFIKKKTQNWFEILNLFSGGSLSRISIFLLGIMPNISASILMQLMTLCNTYFSELKQDGEYGRLKINQYIRYVTLLVSIIQSIFITKSLQYINGINEIVVFNNFLFYFTGIVSLVVGTMFLMWLCETITNKGIGNGISIIIFTGIISGLPNSIANTINQIRKGNFNFLLLLLVLIFIFLFTFFVVFIERGQRRIVVSYANIQQQGRRIYSAYSTHLPLKLNISGVTPAIFSSSIIILLSTLISFLRYITKYKFMNSILIYLKPGNIFYIVLYSILIIVCCFIYTYIIFNPRETADKLKKSGAFILGIRPGEKTSKFLNKIVIRLTLLGSIYINFICIIPEFMFEEMKVPFNFGGTSLLIVVLVIIDFINQVQTLVMSSKYESFFKKIK